ncbi:MAG TPA: hypothetical protein VKU85_15790 [bacterium]|nr:hypothetical protein [bacterium]
MSNGDFLRRYRKALGLGWADPPAAAGRKARERPQDAPFPPAAESPGEGAATPDDVRASAAAEDTGVHHVSAYGLDATVMVQPPSGDDLWTLRGRVWLEGDSETPIRVALVQDEHVLDEATVQHGGRFTFRDLLSGEWTVEFRWGDHAAVIRGNAS